MTDDFDDLDRALFALPLDSPPAGLRAQILRATVYAPEAVAPPFSVWETAAVGVLLALAAWLVIAAVTDHRVGVVFTSAAYAVVTALAEPATLAWVATGGSLALLLTNSNFAPSRRSWRNGR